jgi:hypothetical protein
VSAPVCFYGDEQPWLPLPSQYLFRFNSELSLEIALTIEIYPAIQRHRVIVSFPSLKAMTKLGNYREALKFEFKEVFHGKCSKDTGHGGDA